MKKLMSYSNFKFGDVLLLELPFTDLMGRKLRPVLVISGKNFNKISQDVIVLKITSSQQFEEYEVKLTQKDLIEGRLKKESYVHCYSVFTVEKNLVIKKIAEITDVKLKVTRTPPCLLVHIRC